MMSLVSVYDIIDFCEWCNGWWNYVTTFCEDITTYFDDVEVVSNDTTPHLMTSLSFLSRSFFLVLPRLTVVLWETAVEFYMCLLRFVTVKMELGIYTRSIHQLGPETDVKE